MFKPLALCCTASLGLCCTVSLVLAEPPTDDAPAVEPPVAEISARSAQDLAAQRQVGQSDSFTPQPVLTPNPQIDYESFARNVLIVGELRNKRRVSEADFIRMAQDEKTIVLDARSREKFALMHIRGATNLPMPDFTEEELAAVIPTKETRVLIYCNNNFREAPIPFPTKSAVMPSETSFAVSLNVHTFNQLYNYGYRNVYELAPVLVPTDSALTFDGTETEDGKALPSATGRGPTLTRNTLNQAVLDQSVLDRLRNRNAAVLVEDPQSLDGE